MSMIDSIVQELWAKKSVFWSKMTLFGPKKRFLALKSDQGPKSKIGLRSALIFVVLDRKNPSGTPDRLRSSPKVVVYAHFSTFTILLYSRLAIPKPA